MTGRTICSAAVVLITVLYNASTRVQSFHCKTSLSIHRNAALSTVTSPSLLYNINPPRKTSLSSSSFRHKTKLNLSRRKEVDNGDTTSEEEEEEEDAKKKRRPSIRRKFINLSAFQRLQRRKKSSSDVSSSSSSSNAQQPIEVTTIQQLEQYYDDPEHRFRKSQKSKKRNRKRKHQPPSKANDDDNNDDRDYDALITNLSIKGNTQTTIGSPSHPNLIHPVLRLLHNRRRSNSPLTPIDQQPRPDDHAKVALVVEGGGMRGCVTAGMVAAIHYLGLEDTFDCIYGASAGTIIGAYFNTGQLPFFGPEIYYDSLTTAGRRFIDTRRLLRVVGLGLLDPRLYKDVVTKRGNGKPVLSLDFLLRETMMEKKPLDWDTFVQKQKVQPLKVVASNLKREKIVVLEMANGGFDNIEQLSKCMHASCLIPGIAGPLMNINMDAVVSNTNNSQTQRKPPSMTTAEKFSLGNSPNTDKRNHHHQQQQYSSSMEPFADALVYEPLPYRTAIAEGATHVLVLRSIPDGVDVTGKASLFDPLILKRYFLRKNKLPEAYRYLRNKFHKKLYGEQILELNEFAVRGCHGEEEKEKEEGKAHVMTIALPPGSPGVARLETGRKEIFEGVRRGFARTYDALVEDTKERGKGFEVAKRYFPDEILEYDPLEIHAKDEAAFDYFRREMEDKGEEMYDFPESLGMTALEAGLPR